MVARPNVAPELRAPARGRHQATIRSTAGDDTRPLSLGRHGTSGVAVLCDQAIFTSIPSPMGSGYRLVAASTGLDPNEKRHIVARCPSHDGLADEGPHAEAVSFYPLPTGRLCTAYTCPAGDEHTARGGKRVYTRLVVVDPDTYRAFGGNPFDWVRAMRQADDLQPDLKPPATLPPLELCPRFAPPSAELSAAVSQIGPAWTSAVVARMLLGEPMVILGDFAPLPLLEALLVSLPLPLRATLSVSAGLRYALSRGFEVSILNDADDGRLRQALQGHNVALIQPSSGRTKPPAVDCPWCLMVGRRWSAQLGERLIALNAADFPNVSPESLQLYGRLETRRDAIDHAEAGDLIELLHEHLAETVTDEVAARLAIGITSNATARLADLFSTAPIEQLAAHWDALLALWRRSGSTVAILAPVAGKVLKRATRLAPVPAARMARELVTTHPQGALAEPVRAALGDLLDHLAEWIHDQPADRLADLAHVLRTWVQQSTASERLTRLLAQLNQRLGAGNPAAV